MSVDAGPGQLGTRGFDQVEDLELVPGQQGVFFSAVNVVDNHTGFQDCTVVISSNSDGQTVFVWNNKNLVVVVLEVVEDGQDIVVVDGNVVSGGRSERGSGGEDASNSRNRNHW